MIPVNRKVGKFEILRKLARGGMADVYLGRDDDTGGTIALKLIEHGPDPDTVDSIEAERRGRQRVADVLRALESNNAGEAHQRTQRQNPSH